MEVAADTVALFVPGVVAAAAVVADLPHRRMTSVVANLDGDEVVNMVVGLGPDRRPAFPST